MEDSIPEASSGEGKSLFKIQRVECSKGRDGGLRFLAWGVEEVSAAQADVGLSV